MPKYSYTGKTIQNRVVKGTLEAVDKRALMNKLRAENLFLVSCKELAAETGAERRLKSMELSDFGREVSTMISAGIVVFRALGIMKERDVAPHLRKTYEQLYNTVQEGNTLSEAMIASNGRFPELMINVFKAGEASGKLDQSSMEMSVYYEKEHKLRVKIRNALTYPMILLCLTVTIVLAIFTLVLPAFFDMFEGMDIPAITVFMLNISRMLTQNWLLSVVFVMLFVAVIIIISSQSKVKYFFDRLKLGIPKIGRLMKIIYTARFARALSSLYSSGLPMLDAVRISSSVVGSRYIQAQFDKVLEAIRTGNSLSAAIDEVDGFDKKLKSTIRIGEETGKLDIMLKSMADSYEYESEMATANLVVLIEPVMIIVMAVIIGTIILSVMLPIMTVYQSAGSI